MAEQRKREQEAAGLDLAIQRWTREQERATGVADHKREKKDKGIDATAVPSKTPLSIVGVVHIPSPVVACASDDTSTCTSTTALLEVSHSHACKLAHQASTTYAGRKFLTFISSRIAMDISEWFDSSCWLAAVQTCGQLNFPQFRTHRPGRV